MGFKDHFSGFAADYARQRPAYPPELFEWLAGQAPSKEHAWDCATGNGQAAVELARHFERVTATDASPEQLEQAEARAGVAYALAPAEHTGLESGTVDLVTVAQALHWFDFDRFYAEVRRVAKPGGLLAVWCYDLFTCTPEIDAVIHRFYTGPIGEHWPPERRYIDARYLNLPFPFEEVEAPTFHMRAEWTAEQALGYLGTWSAVARYKASGGSDPIPALAEEVLPLWGAPEQKRAIRWNLGLRAGRVSAA